MPGYSYKCGKCKHIIQMTLPISTDPKKRFACECGYLMKRIIAGGASFKGFKVFAGDWFKKEYGFDIADRPTTKAEFQRDVKRAEEKHKRDMEC